MDVFLFNLYANCRNSLFMHFLGLHVMTLQPEVMTIWGQMGSKNTFWKKEGAQILFQFLRASLGSLLHLWSILQYVFSLFHF